jgi:PAS domain S-box-containing protein
MVINRSPGASGEKPSNVAPVHIKTEAALRESEKKLSQIVLGLSIAAFVIDENHVITHCNRAFENLTGISASELVGTGNQWKTFYPAKRPTLADLIVDRATEVEIAQHYPGKYRKSDVIDGAYEVEDFFPRAGVAGRWLFFTAAPLMDDEGNIAGAIETLQDITDRKRAEERLRHSERHLRATLDFVPYPIVVFTLEGLVSYLNPAFTETFGWALEELEGKNIPFVPPGLEKEIEEGIERLMKDRGTMRFETQRLTRAGKTLDVVLRAAVFSESGDEPAGTIVILRDVTHEKRMARTNEAMLRISMALPEYPELDELLYYVNSEVKRLVSSEGAIAVLHDEIKGDLFVLGAAYDDMATEERVQEFRFSKDQLLAGEVIRTGEPVIISDTSKDRRLHEERDGKFGYHTRNLVIVPIKSAERNIGALSAINKKEGVFDHSDVELLGTIAGTVALSIENARFAEELKKAYKEVTALNRAKDKAINHLSHELKTPVAIIISSLNLLIQRLAPLTEKAWKPTVDRILRNLDRILDIQYEVDDIMEDKQSKALGLLTLLLDQCTDELMTLTAEQDGEGSFVEKVRKRIEDLFGPREAVSKEMDLGRAVQERLEALTPLFPQREVDIVTRVEPTPPIFLPSEVLQKVIDGLIKNAIENTPDEGRIEIGVLKRGEGAMLRVQDYGVGIPDEAQKRIFEGFFTTRDTMTYSTKTPFEFNAGGKGADLLRMKIFSERYSFQIGMTSTRCPFLRGEADLCPGRISQCKHCSGKERCHRSGGTVFSITFPPATQPKKK